MKTRLWTLLVCICCAFVVKAADIPGTVILNKITLGSDAITNKAIGDTVEMKGTPKSVTSILVRNNIPAARRDEGMTAYVTTNATTYILIGGIDNTNWQVASVTNLINSTDGALTNQETRNVLLANSLSVTGNVSGGLAVGGQLFNHVLAAFGYLGNPMRDEHQVAAYAALTYASNSSGADTFVCGFESAVGTEPGNYTVSNAFAFSPATFRKGAGSTITRTVNYGISDQTAGTFNAQFAEWPGVFTNDWFMYYPGQRSSQLGSGNTALTLGRDIFRDTSADYLRLSGGHAGSYGASVVMFGQDHSTLPNYLQLNGAGGVAVNGPTVFSSSLVGDAGGLTNINLSSTPALTNNDTRNIALANSLSVTGNISGGLAVGGQLFDHVLVSAGHLKNPLRSEHQVGFYSALSYASNSAGPDTFLGGFESSISSQPGNYTLSNAVNFAPATVVKGAGSTITRTVNYAINDQQAGTFNAQFAETPGTFTNDWFLYYPGQRSSQLGSGNTTLTLGRDVFREIPTDFLRVSGGDAATLGAHIVMFSQSHGSLPNYLQLNGAGGIALNGATTIESSSSPLIANVTGLTLNHASGFVDLKETSTSGVKLRYDSNFALTYLDNYFSATQSGQVYGSIWLQTKQAGGSTLVPGIVLEGYTGNVGIGTTGPTNKLQVIGDVGVTSLPYDATTWNGNLTVPTRDDIRDKIEALSLGAGGFPHTTNIVIMTNAAGSYIEEDFDATGGGANLLGWNFVWQANAGSKLYRASNGLHIFGDAYMDADLHVAGTINATGIISGNGSGLTNLTSTIKAGSTNFTTLTAVTVAFASAFPTTNYTATCIGNGFALASFYVSSKTTTSVTFNFGLATGSVDWQAVMQTQ